MAIHVVFLIIYILFGSFLPPEYLMALSIMQCIVALVVKLRFGSEFLSPYIMGLMALVITNAGNISLINRVTSGTNIMYYFASPQDFPEAAQIWVIANCLYFIGYLLLENKSLPSVSLIVNKKVTKNLFTIVLVMALFASPIRSALHSLGALAKVIGLIASVGILFYARLWASQDSGIYRNYAISLWIIQTINALNHASLRVEIVLPTVVFFIGYFVGKGKAKYIISYRVIPFVLVFVVFLNLFAELGKNRNNFGNALIEAYTLSDEEEEATEDEVYVKTDRGAFLDRSGVLAQISATSKLVRKNGFYNGAASSPLIIALVPRFLWKDKPEIKLGQWFTAEMGIGITDDRGHVNNSINMTIPGELFIDFGWVGVLFGCFFFGSFVAVLWGSAQFFTNNFNLIGSIFGGYLLTLAYTGISIDLQIVVTYTSTYLLFLIIKKICVYYQ